MKEGYSSRIVTTEALVTALITYVHEIRDTATTNTVKEYMNTIMDDFSIKKLEEKCRFHGGHEI